MRNKGYTVVEILLVIVLICLLLSVLPVWGYSASFGYYPSGVITLLVVIVIIYLLTRRGRGL